MSRKPRLLLLDAGAVFAALRFDAWEALVSAYEVVVPSVVVRVEAIFYLSREDERIEIDAGRGAHRNPGGDRPLRGEPRGPRRTGPSAHHGGDRGDLECPSSPSFRAAIPSGHSPGSVSRSTGNEGAISYCGSLDPLTAESSFPTTMRSRRELSGRDPTSLKPVPRAGPPRSLC
jgi:hypothetical protein